MFDFNTITPVQIFQQITDVANNPAAVCAGGGDAGGVGGIVPGGEGAAGAAGSMRATTKAATAAAPRRLRGPARAGRRLLPLIVVLAARWCRTLAVILTSLTCHRAVVSRRSCRNRSRSAISAPRLMDDWPCPASINSMHYAIAGDGGGGVRRAGGGDRASFAATFPGAG